VVLEDFFWPGDFQIFKVLHRRLFLLLCLRDGCGLLDPFRNFLSATNNVRPIQGGAAAATRRQHGLEVADEAHLKGLFVFFVSIRVLCIV
jgi:hypothetical protein